MKRGLFRKIIAFLVMPVWLMTAIPMPSVRAQALLPAPDQMVGLTPSFKPAMLSAVKVDPQDPFRIDFLLDPGDNWASADLGRSAQAKRLVKYFLAALTVPEADLWVNLSPYEKDRIVPPAFGRTEMGRDLLAQDYILKQLSSSLLFPDSDSGKEFWGELYRQSRQSVVQTDIPRDVLNKVWIAPAKAVVYENKGAAYVVEASLKVMLDEDYQKQGAGNPDPAESLSSDARAVQRVLREVIVPLLEKEVNEGQRFAQLRQIYRSLILASWYKKKIQSSLLARVYADRNKVAGVDIRDPKEAEKIWRQYAAAFQKGVFNLIREDVDPVSREVVPRKYFAGGVRLNNHFEHQGDLAHAELPRGQWSVSVRLDQAQQTSKFTRERRNIHDLHWLLYSNVFFSKTGLNVREGELKVVDIGVGYPPITPMELGRVLRRHNPHIQVTGTDLKEAVVRREVVFSSSKDPLFMGLAHIIENSDYKGLKVEEVSFLVTDKKDDSLVDVKEIMVKAYEDGNENATFFPVAYAPSVEVIDHEMPFGSEERAKHQKLFSNLMGLVGPKRLKDLLNGKQKLPGVRVTSDPAARMLESAGVAFIETDNLPAAGLVERDLITVSNVLVHYRQTERDNFFKMVTASLREGGVCVVKNGDLTSLKVGELFLYKLDVYKKLDGKLAYLGSVLSDDYSKIILDEQDFKVYASQRGSNYFSFSGAGDMKDFIDHAQRGGDDKAKSTWKATREGRQKSFLSLVRDRRFIEATGLDLMQGKPLVQDIGAGYLPVSVLEMRQGLAQMNPDVKIESFELSQALARQSIVISREDKALFPLLLKRLQKDDFFTDKEVLEIHLLVTDQGVRSQAGISEVMVKVKNKQGVVLYIPAAYANAVDLMVMGEEVSVDDRKQQDSLLRDLLGIAGVERLKSMRALLEKRKASRLLFRYDPHAEGLVEDATGASGIEMRHDPVRELLQEQGVLLREGGDLVVSSQADLITVNHVLVHLDKDGREKFFKSLESGMKDGAVCMITNTDSVSMKAAVGGIQYKHDVYKKIAGKLHYLGSTPSAAFTGDLFESDTFKSYFWIKDGENDYAPEWAGELEPLFDAAQVQGADQQAVTWHNTQVGRNHDVVRLATMPEFAAITGLDLRTGEHKIVDIGVGYPAVTTLEAQRDFQAINPKIRLQGAEKRPAVIRQDITVFKKDGGLFKRLNDRLKQNPLLRNKNIEEIHFLVTDQGVRADANIAQVMLKYRLKDGTEAYASIAYPRGVGLLALGRTIKDDEAERGAQMFYDLLNIVGVERLHQIQQKASEGGKTNLFFDNELDLGVIDPAVKGKPAAMAVSNDPVRTAFNDAGIEWSEIDNLAALQGGGLFMFNNALVHLPRKDREEFFMSLEKVMQEKNVLIVKNIVDVSTELYPDGELLRFDIYMKRASLVYLGTVVRSPDSERFFQKEEFLEYAYDTFNNNALVPKHIKGSVMAVNFFDAAQRADSNQLGGVDLTGKRLSLESNGDGASLEFKIDPIILARLEKTSGFKPVIVHLEPDADPAGFLGLLPPKAAQ